MRICFVTKEYPPETMGGGIATYAHDTAHALSSMGNEVIVLSQSSESRIYNEGNVIVHRMKYRERRPPFLAYDKRIKYPCLVKRYLSKLGKFDIIESAEFGAEMFFLRKMKNSVVRLHTPTFVIDKLSGRFGLSDIVLKPVFNKMEASVIKNASSVTSCSRELADIVFQKIGIMSKVIPNGIDVSKFRGKYIDMKKKLDTDGPMVLYQGTLSKRKGASIFARAIPKIVKNSDKRPTFVFSGKDAGERAVIEHILSGCDADVRFTGFAENPADFYRSADIVVIPSIWENFPYVCLEAMVCGKPVVGSSAGGMSEIIEHGKSGFLAETQNQDSYAEHVLTLLNNKKTLREMGRQAFIRIKKSYDIKIIAKQTFEHYESLL